MKKKMQKAILVFLTAALFFCGSVLCTFAQFDDPEIPDVAEEALALVPGSAYAATPVTAADALLRYEGNEGFSDCTAVYFRELVRRDLVSLHYLYDEPQILQDVFEELYGPGIFELWEWREALLEDFLNGDYTENGSYQYKIETPSIRRDYSSSAGYGIGVCDYLSYETDGDTMYVYQRVGYYKNDGDTYEIRGGALLDSDVSADLPVLAGGRDSEHFTDDPSSVCSRFHNGEYSEYLPVYKHTFRENGKGGYYWVSTEVDLPGREIPAEETVLREEGSSDSRMAEVSQSGSAAGFSDSSSGALEVRQEDVPLRFLPAAVWICTGILAVAAVCIVRSAVKKKKKR